LTALDLLGKAEQERDEANAACESHEVERTMAEARVAELEAATAPETLAQAFHENYELLAPEYGYKTREASAVPWDEVPDNNKQLMVATARAALAAVRQEKP
jgi:hypothetical protein